MATIVDVAREAGVSVATVSRVMNNSVIVSAEKRELVYAAMKKVGYIPSERVKGKQKGEIKTILIFTAIFVHDFLASCSSQLFELGYEVLIHPMVGREGEWEEGKETLKRHLERNLTGVILYHLPVIHDREFVDLLNQTKVIQVGACCSLKENYVISTDNRRMVFEAVTHLLEQGRRRVALLMTKSLVNTWEYIDLRERGYMDALWQYNLPRDEKLKFDCGFSVKEAYIATRDQILTTSPRPDAIFCMNDMLATGCMAALFDAGVQIPEEIAVMGVDNGFSSPYLPVALSTIDQQETILGMDIVRFLDEIITGVITQGRTIYTPHRMIYRTSTEGKTAGRFFEYK